MQIALIQTPLGIAQITGDDIGITSISILDSHEARATKIPKDLQEAVTQLNEYFLGERCVFTFRLNPTGTDFQKKVWKELRQITFGKTVSYLELAKKLGDVKAIRAVAAANGKNPLWIVVPCRRVIGTDGSLTGYAGKLWRKKWLLEHENPSAQQLLFLPDST